MYLDNAQNIYAYIATKIQQKSLNTLFYTIKVVDKINVQYSIIIVLESKKAPSTSRNKKLENRFLKFSVVSG